MNYKKIMDMIFFLNLKKMFLNLKNIHEFVNIHEFKKKS